MNIYEIDQAMQSLVDPETGEIGDFEAFDALVMERGKKIENAALFYKNISAEAAAIKAEEAALKERREKAENNANRLKEYLSYALGGEKYSTPKVFISWRPSQIVSVEDEAAFAKSAENSAYLVPQPPKIDKTAIKSALKSGSIIPGAALVSKNNIQIK